MSKPFISRKITLTIEVSGTDMGITDEAIKEHLNFILNTFEDGNYPLPVELLRKSVNEIAEQATKQAIYDRCRKKYKPVMVKSRDGLSSRPVVSMFAERESANVSSYPSKCKAVGVETTYQHAGDGERDFPEIKEEDYLL